jgi:hypothetical protein
MLDMGIQVITQVAVGVGVLLLLLVKMVGQGQIIHIQITVHLLIMVQEEEEEAQSNVGPQEQQEDRGLQQGIKDLVHMDMLQQIKEGVQVVLIMDYWQMAVLV